jgi:hypothetical protein
VKKVLALLCLLMLTGCRDLHISYQTHKHTHTVSGSDTEADDSALVIEAVNEEGNE